MPVLSNSRHELFCQHVIAGKTHAEAYSAIFPKGKHAASMGSRLSETVKVRQRIAELKEKLSARVIDSVADFSLYEISKREHRVKALELRWKKLQRVIDARAIDLKDIPGGDTGLLVRQLKSVGFGENNQLVEEYAVDTGLLKEMRAHEEQAAKEIGQWAAKPEDAPVVAKPVLPEWLRQQLTQIDRDGDTTPSPLSGDSTATSQPVSRVIPVQ